MVGLLSKWLPALKDRFSGMSFNLAELSGSLGDLGTFIPLVTAMIVNCHLDPGSVLLFAGLYNIVTGLTFKQPIPVQPMKAIAAVAIAEGLSPGAIAASGIGMGVLLLLLAVTGLIVWLEKVIPPAVVRGIQLGVGLKLSLKALDMLKKLPPLGLDSWGVAFVLAGAVLFWQSRREKFPSALLLFTLGIIGTFVISPQLLSKLHWGWSGFHLVIPTAQEWRDGLLYGTIPQFPLTVLNSVIAVCALSSELFKGRGIKTKPMTLSVSLMNLVGSWFGAIPMCHGSGGLAGQYHFGARTGGSVVMLGVGKIAIALLLGAAAVPILSAYPKSILGILLLFAGLELSLPARHSFTRGEFFTTAVTAAGCLALNTLGGFILGVVSAVLAGGLDNGKKS